MGDEEKTLIGAYFGQKKLPTRIVRGWHGRFLKVTGGDAEGKPAEVGGEQEDTPTKKRKRRRKDLDGEEE